MYLTLVSKRDGLQFEYSSDNLRTMFEFMPAWVMEVIGWSSTAAFLISIVVPSRSHLHWLGVFASVTTGLYAYHHGATAIWVKWFIAFFFHAYMIKKCTTSVQNESLL